MGLVSGFLAMIFVNSCCTYPHATVQGYINRNPEIYLVKKTLPCKSGRSLKSVDCYIWIIMPDSYNIPVVLTYINLHTKFQDPTIKGTLKLDLLKSDI